jgi:plasmid maintenance system antidote protein VapI
MMIYGKGIRMSDHEEYKDQDNQNDQEGLEALKRQWRALQARGHDTSSTHALENRVLFGVFVAALMNQKGIAVDILADAVDTTEEHITSLMQGTVSLSRLSDDLLARLAIALDIDPNVLNAFLNKALLPRPPQDQDDT